MGESSSDNDNSGGDEAMEVAEREADQSNPNPGNNFGGDQTNLSNDFSNSPNQGGYSSPEAQANYNAGQVALSNAINAGISPTNVGRVGIDQIGGLNAFGGSGGAASNQQTAGIQSNLGDMLGGSLLEIDPINGVNNYYSPNTVPDLELMNPQRFDPFNITKQVNDIIRDRDNQGFYTQVTRDDRGNVTGAFNDAPMFGLGFMPNVKTYTGLDDNPYNEDRSYMDGGDSPDIVPPITNPLTGTSRCPDGYKFDEDLQACRLDTKREDKKKTTTDSELFFRQTALDTAPSNIPSGFDFDAANKRFTQGYAFNPSFYNRPMSTTGFTPFSSFKPFNK